MAINSTQMAETLYKFPSTPHLLWLGGGSVRDDKVLTHVEMEAFLSGPVVVEEKIDGANLGISFDQTGKMRLQNRGNWLEGKLSGQWESLRGWAAKRLTVLRSVLPENHIVFGEWCYATHSVHYNDLPDWFLLFDVYDTVAEKFWNGARRNELAAAAGLAVVPQIAQGRFTLDQVRLMLDGKSAFSNEPIEGIYFRREHGNWLTARAKLVGPGFTQAIAEHWSKKQLLRNRLHESIPLPG
jgi:hypothetical protein